MTWTIDEARVMPFLKAAHRRDLLGRLRRPGPVAARGAGPEDAVPAPEPGGTPGREAKSFKDFKDGKEFKDYKDRKDFKDYKDLKDLKDSKDGKDRKDTKDGKDFKDSKDVSDGAWTPAGCAAPLAARPVDRPQTMAAGSDPGTDGILSVLRASRASRFLKERGLVI
ncbi:hypothetical protein [Streptomyces actinomycinicus]|uniref:hypothetical protein n=1 Tax=Streptomyces actinomycinicus TaxID=1695166 RepID=UPI001F2DC52F|nr:hypothetical protein [Streptomyces actinomycinicus]